MLSSLGLMNLMAVEEWEASTEAQSRQASPSRKGALVMGVSPHHETSGLSTAPFVHATTTSQKRLTDAVKKALSFATLNLQCAFAQRRWLVIHNHDVVGHTLNPFVSDL